MLYLLVIFLCGEHTVKFCFNVLYQSKLFFQYNLKVLLLVNDSKLRILGTDLS